MYARIEIPQTLCAFFIRPDALECDIENLAIIDDLLLKNLCSFCTVGVRVGTGHGIDKSDELGQALDTCL